MRWLFVLGLVAAGLAWLAGSARDVALPQLPAAIVEAPPEAPDDATAQHGEVEPPVAGAVGHVVPDGGAADAVDGDGAGRSDADPVHDGIEIITVIVRDENDAPVAGARVYACDGERDLCRAVSDAEGRAELAAVPLDSELRLVAVGFLPHRGRADPQRVEQLVRLVAAPVLRARVFAPDGSRVAGALAVLLEPYPGRAEMPIVLSPWAKTATSDERGEFGLPWPDRAAFDLVVTAAGFAPFVAHQLHPDAVGERVFDVTMKPGAVLSGVVRNVLGAPMPNAQVNLWSAPAEPRRNDRRLGMVRPFDGGRVVATVRTDASGRFVVRDLLPGLVWADFGGPMVGSPVAAVLHAGSEATVELVAEELAVVQGTAAGAAPGQQVFLYDGQRTLTVAVGLDGSFRFDKVIAGRYLVGACVEPFAEHLHAVVQQFVVDGWSTHCVTIEVAPGDVCEVELGPGKSATGTVTGTAFRDGLPAVGCEVVIESLRGIGAHRRQALVDASGAFRIDAAAPDDYRVKLVGALAQVLAEQSCRVIAGNAAFVTLQAP